MNETVGAREELLELAARFRHLRAEAGRAAEGGSTKRRLQTQMQETAERAERRIEELVHDQADRQAWRDHVHHGGPAPSRPEEAAPPPPPPVPPERPEGRRPWPR